MGGDPRDLNPTLPASRFVTAARRLGAAARTAGLDVPAFRSPPRVAGAVRTLRQFPSGSVVSVTLRGRRFDDVVVDMVEGVVRANHLAGDAAAAARQHLLGAATGRGVEGDLPSPPARMAKRQTQAA
jgi:hypothetical protein